METLDHLLQNNRVWAEKIKAQDPEFFETLSKQQRPHYLWIGCSDSRVPANQIIDITPGDMFVHRNVANVVVHTDLNCLSVVQYAVEVLEVKHLIVCGHYGCGGVRAALENSSLGLIDNWLRHVQDVRQKHQAALAKVADDDRLNKLCELNVIEQVSNLCQTTIVQSAWQRGQQLSVHGWIYGLSDGLIRDLNVSTDSQAQLAANQRDAVTRQYDSSPSAITDA
jgi:carbonic anhydrase